MTFVPVYVGDRSQYREWPVPSGTVEGTPLLSESGEPGVTITPRGDSTITKTLAGGYSIAYPNGPVGVRDDSAVVAPNGTFAGPVTGADATTVKNTLVYIATDGTLTLTATGNTKFGVVDAYLGKASATDTAVKIGVFA